MKIKIKTNKAATEELLAKIEKHLNGLPFEQSMLAEVMEFITKKGDFHARLTHYGEETVRLRAQLPNLLRLMQSRRALGVEWEAMKRKVGIEDDEPLDKWIKSTAQKSNEIRILNDRIETLEAYLKAVSQVKTNLKQIRVLKTQIAETISELRDMFEPVDER